MSGQVAFGNRQYASWIKAPESPMNSPFKGPVSQRVLSTGQVVQHSALRRRKGFEFIFKGSELDLQPFFLFFEGLNGSGPWLYNNPRALLGNMLPATWASPALAVGTRGNQALDLYTGAVSFSGAVKANPYAAPATITGLTGAPLIGAKCFSPNNTVVPAYPAVTGSRPYQSFLIPPNYGARFTVWGVRNSGTSPVIAYGLSTVSPANVTIPATGTLAPAAAGTSLEVVRDAVNWRVLDLWVTGGTSAPANTDWTILSAMDLRMTLGSTPSVPVVFDRGRGQFPIDFTDEDTPYQNTYIGASDGLTYYEIDLKAEEMASPW